MSPPPPPPPPPHPHTPTDTTTTPPPRPPGNGNTVYQSPILHHVVINIKPGTTYYYQVGAAPARGLRVCRVCRGGRGAC